MTTTPRGSPELASAQAIPEATVNEQIRRTEGGANYYTVADRVTSPPGSCASGAQYIIIATASGAFTGKEGQIAQAVGTNAANGWLYRTLGTLDEGVEAYVQDEDVTHKWSGSAWATAPGGGTASGLDYDTDGTLAANSDGKIATQKATKTYTDTAIAAAVNGLSWKQRVRAATTANGTLATDFENGDTVDGVVLATGDRILLKNQSTGAENGIYVVAASGAPTRATDADSGAELVNATVFVSEGTTNADTIWTCTTNATITVGSTSLTFATISAGSYLPLSGGTLSGPLEVPDDAYDSTDWDGNNEVPTKNAIRDKIEAIVSGGGSGSSTTQILTGTDTTTYATPDAIAALWEQGSDVASSGTISLGEGGYFNITGTTTITDIDFGTDKAGRKAWVKFAGALTLTHSGSTLILPGGGNITTAAGDTACFVSEGSDVVRCVSYQRASGLASTVRGALVKKAADQTAADYSSGAVVTWDNEGTGCYDTDGVHDTSSNQSRLGTPSWARWAKVGYCIVGSNVTGATDCFSQVLLNGSDLGPGNAWLTTDLDSSTLPRVTAWTAWVPLTTPGTDYFEIKWQTSGDNSSTVHAASWAAIEFRA